MPWRSSPFGAPGFPLSPWEPADRQLGAIGLAACAYFAVSFLLAGVAVAVHERAPVPATLRGLLPYQAFVSPVLLSAAPLVVVVMGRSALLVLLFLLPLGPPVSAAARAPPRLRPAPRQADRPVALPAGGPHTPAG